MTVDLDYDGASEYYNTTSRRAALNYGSGCGSRSRVTVCERTVALAERR